MLVVRGGAQGVVAQGLQDPEAEEDERDDEHDQRDQHDKAVLGHEDRGDLHDLGGQVDAGLEAAEEDQDRCGQDEADDGNHSSGSGVLEQGSRTDAPANRLRPDVNPEDHEGTDAEEDQDVDEAPSSEPDNDHEYQSQDDGDGDSQQDQFPALHQARNLLAVAAGCGGDGFPEGR